MLEDFKKFIMKGNVVDLAVAVIIGIAFGLSVNSFAKDIIMPIVGAVVGKPSFNDLTLEHRRRRHPLRQLPHRARELPDHRFVLFLIIQAAEKLQKLARLRGRSRRTRARSTSSSRSATC